MTSSGFEIGADGVDAARIVADIQARVAEKTQRGVYSDSRVARAERTNLAHIKDQDNFLAFYLDCLSDAVFVDINDFEIHERRPHLGKLLIICKRLIWKLLKFYTYRLWSQQNQVNGLLLSAVEHTERQWRERLVALEKRVKQLETPR